MRKGTFLATSVGAMVVALSTSTLTAAAAPHQATGVVQHEPGPSPSERGISALQEPAPEIAGALFIAPDAYQVGQTFTISVSGTLSVTSAFPLSCKPMRLQADAEREILRSAWISDSISVPPGVATALTISGELRIDSTKIPMGQAVKVYVYSTCWNDNTDGSFFGNVIFGRHTIAPPSIQVGIDQEWILPDAERRTVPKIKYFSAEGVPTLSILRDGKPVWTFEAASTRGSKRLPLSVVAPRGTYVLRISASQETPVDLRLPVFHRVSSVTLPIFGYVGAWERCSTIRWRYDDNKAPQGSSTLPSELKKVMRYYSRVTGLRFVQVEKGGNFRVLWSKSNGANGPAGVGSFVGSSGGSFEWGQVELNALSDWARTPGMKDPGRGPLLFHEVGHTLGLGHVRNRSSLMHRAHFFGESDERPSKYEEAFLRELYQPQTCN